ncbi:predicted protein [Micromonas commoda]|uniref:Uncharacterized protein n=1 Tax=Micromonas commoda (strain RCC299 / NOUM17 / CCMP2709) TaxID=296587 RepID=C1FJK0_MICCC|nr:predicted protein [Micromonas commoda]ACO70361.1 predicted protein [Micromonas commoda]|eukprot:XP_002509103.1 predicted protein [Micromonas commoda]
MLAITLFWIVAFGVMIYFMIKEWKGLSRATRAKNLKLRTVIIPGRGTVQVVAKPAPPGDPEYVPPTVSQGPRRKRMVDGELELPR